MVGRSSPRSGNNTVASFFPSHQGISRVNGCRYETSAKYCAEGHDNSILDATGAGDQVLIASISLRVLSC